MKIFFIAPMLRLRVLFKILARGFKIFELLFLEKLGVLNFKVATELLSNDATGHIWNAVYLDGSWLHLDLTWDDPVSSDGKDYLQHKYFLITSKELENIDTSGEVTVSEHTFSYRIYPELKIID